MADQYEELRRLAAEATPGPWKDGNFGSILVGDKANCHAIMSAQTNSGMLRNYQANTAFIVAAVNSLPSILAELDALREDARRYQLLRRGQHWSVINGIGDVLRADALDAAIDALHPSKDADSGEVGNG